MAANCDTCNIHLIPDTIYTLGYHKIKSSEKNTCTADAGYTHVNT